jgi:hypothetical protein
MMSKFSRRAKFIMRKRQGRMVFWALPLNEILQWVGWIITSLIRSGSEASEEIQQVIAPVASSIPDRTSIPSTPRIPCIQPHPLLFFSIPEIPGILWPLPGLLASLRMSQRQLCLSGSYLGLGCFGGSVRCGLGFFAGFFRSFPGFLLGTFPEASPLFGVIDGELAFFSGEDTRTFFHFAGRLFEFSGFAPRSPSELLKPERSPKT